MRQDFPRVMERTQQSRGTSMVAKLLLLLLFGVRMLAICPQLCTCSRGHRVVDCSEKGLATLPGSLQHNIHFLNLSHNLLQDLDWLLKHFDHLRTLDISYNNLNHLPVGLPRALWDIRASGNYIRQLEKNDTAYHWNLQNLDLSLNLLERVVFINNTLSNLQTLNISHNKFWTVPTNMPCNLEMVDLSHNYLLQILPGSLDRLSRLQRFYLHANRFTLLSEGIFDGLDELQLLTLGDNHWACEDEDNINQLQTWMQKTKAKILGCPCYIRPTCGEIHQNTREIWDSATFTETPLLTETMTASDLSKSTLFNAAHNPMAVNTSWARDQVMIMSWPKPTPTSHGHARTTIRTRSAKKALPGRVYSRSNQLTSSSETTILSILCTLIFYWAL